MQCIYRKDILKEIYYAIIVCYIVFIIQLIWVLYSIEIIKMWFVEKCYFLQLLFLVMLNDFIYNMQIGMDNLEINIWSTRQLSTFNDSFTFNDSDMLREMLIG